MYAYTEVSPVWALPQYGLSSHTLVWLFDEKEMNTVVAINALTAEDSYSVAQNWRRHDDSTVWSLLDQSVERGVSFSPTHGNRTFKLFIHFLPLNGKMENQGDFLFLIFFEKTNMVPFLFSIKLNLKKINIHRPFQDSIIPKYSEYPHRCGDWQPHINSKPQIHPRRGAVPMRNPCKENNSANNCNCKFQTEMAIKRQNLLQLKNISFLLWWIVKCNLFLWFKAEFSASLLQSSVPHDPSESFYSIYTYLCFPTGRKDSVTNDYWRSHEWIHWPDRWYCPFWK